MNYWKPWWNITSELNEWALRVVQKGERSSPFLMNGCVQSR